MPPSTCWTEPSSDRTSSPVAILNQIKRETPDGKTIHVICRQLRRLQEGQGSGMARSASALDLLLQANLLLLAQCRREVLRQAHPAQAQARRLLLRRRSPDRHQPLRLGIQCRKPKTLRLESQPQIIAARNRGFQMLDSFHSVQIGHVISINGSLKPELDQGSQP